MKLKIQEEDYEAVLGKNKAKVYFGRGDALLGNTAKDKVLELLPRVIAKKMQDIVPDGFDVTEMLLTCDISGKPFGIGVAGKVSVKFGRKA